VFIIINCVMRMIFHFSYFFFVTSLHHTKPPLHYIYTPRYPLVQKLTQTLTLRLLKFLGSSPRHWHLILEVPLSGTRLFFNASVGIRGITEGGSVNLRRIVETPSKLFADDRWVKLTGGPRSPRF